METEQIKKISTKKLQALLATADESDCMKIKEELAYRGEPAILSGEAIKLSGTKSKSVTYDADEVKERMAELQKNVGRMARVRKKGELTWTEAQVTSVYYNKPTAAFFYYLRTIDGEKIMRYVMSDMVILIDEYRPLVKYKKTFVPLFIRKDTLTIEEAEKLRDEKAENIGRYANVAVSETETHCCVLRVVSLNRKRCTVHYTFSDLDQKGKPIYRNVNTPGIEFTDEYDEDIRRAGKRGKFRRKPSSLDRLQAVEMAMKEAEDKYLKAKETFESIKAEYERMKDMYLTANEDILK